MIVSEKKVLSHNFSHISVIGIEIITKAGKVVVVNHSQNEIHTIIPAFVPHPLDSSAKIVLMFSVLHKSVKGRLARGCPIGVEEVDMRFGIEKRHPMLSWFVGRIRIGYESHSFSLWNIFGESVAGKHAFEHRSDVPVQF